MLFFMEFTGPFLDIFSILKTPPPTEKNFYLVMGDEICSYKVKIFKAARNVMNSYGVTTRKIKSHWY